MKNGNWREYHLESIKKKSSRLLKVGKRSIDSSDSKSFEALENKLKCKFTVEDDLSVVTDKGEEDDDA